MNLIVLTIRIPETPYAIFSRVMKVPFDPFGAIPPMDLPNRSHERSVSIQANGRPITVMFNTVRYNEQGNFFEVDSELVFRSSTFKDECCKEAFDLMSSDPSYKKQQ